MNVLGLDVDFSVTKATNSFCLLNVDEERKEIGLVERAKRFLRGDAPELFASIPASPSRSALSGRRWGRCSRSRPGTATRSTVTL
jgi:hypothetical protein